LYEKSSFISCVVRLSVAVVGTAGFLPNRFTYQKDFKPATIPGEDWNTLLQNAAHSGGINNSQIKLPLQLQWTANTGSNIFMASPIIAGQKVFIATTDDNIPLNTFVCAFDFNSGKLLWKFRTANSVKNTIAYENGIVIAQDAACNLYALDAESGKLLWKQYIKLNSYPYLTEGITIDKGVVYAGIGAGLSAYDLKTGQTIWINKDWRQREGATTTLTVAGNVLVSGTQWGGLYGNDIHTGKQLWKLSDNGLRNRGASPVYKDGKLWIISSKSFFVIEPQTGKVLHKQTCQGFSDNSAWARGQAWAIYGYTMAYRETKKPEFLEMAQRTAEFWLNHSNLPEDMVPYWDFNAGQEGYVPEWEYDANDFKEIPRDASAAAITASALLELYQYVDKKTGKRYYQAAVKTLKSLASPSYLAAQGTNGNFLLKHCVGSIPHKNEIDVPLVYADYYFLEALHRYKNSKGIK